MKLKHWVIGCSAVLALCAAVTIVRSDEKPGQPEMSPEEKAMHEAWMKAGAVGPEHEKMAAMVGKWKAEVKFWHGPGDPEVSYGTSEFKTILGGRFLEEVFNGEAMGQPFEGRGFSGYDNTTKKHISLWMDSMTTGWLTFEGAWDESSKTLVSQGESVDPMGTKWQMRNVCKEKSKNEHVFEMYKTGPDGKEFKALEITYTRM